MNKEKCPECGLPINACNRIAMLQHQVKYLAKAVLEISKDGASAWDYNGEQTVARGIELSNKTAIEDILGIDN